METFMGPRRADGDAPEGHQALEAWKHWAVQQLGEVALTGWLHRLECGPHTKSSQVRLLSGHRLGCGSDPRSGNRWVFLSHIDVLLARSLAPFLSLYNQ